jgi:hypothetical protein
LHDQQNNPASEHRAVNVKEPVGQWSSEDPGQLIGVREADKDRRKNHNSHAGKKEIVESAIGRPDCPSGHKFLSEQK